MKTLIWSAIGLTWGWLVWNHFQTNSLRPFLLPRRFRGGLITMRNGRILRSHVIGQSFPPPRYFEASANAALNPHDAFTQIDRIAAARSMDPEDLRSLVRSHVERLERSDPEAPPLLNSLLLNFDLDNAETHQHLGRQP